jgi:hypothetical protein
VKVQCYYTDSPRPETVPSGNCFGLVIPKNATIWNTSRPLYGSCLMDGDKILTNYGMTWESDFKHGIFYAATFENNATWESKSKLDKLNYEQDGWVVVYVTKEDILAWAKNYLESNGLKMGDPDYPIEYKELRDQYISDHWNIEMELA